MKNVVLGGAKRLGGNTHAQSSPTVVKKETLYLPFLSKAAFS